MLDDLIAIQREVLATTSMEIKRYLYDEINWQAQAICILGDRGVGKTTMLCQQLVEEYKSQDRALYISADNIIVASKGLFKIVQEYITQGGDAVFIDEVHKYPNWSIEVKNIIDTYKNCKVVISGSSSLDLHKSKGDLSRRVVYYQLHGLSFREYIHITTGELFLPLKLEEILENHVAISEGLKKMKILKLFQEYLIYGYYPFFLEGLQDYLLKVHNVIEKVLFEDISTVFNVRQTTLPILKKLLFLVATTDGFTPNIDKISANFGVSREVIYNSLEYLERSGLVHNVYPKSSGFKAVRKPGKIYCNNTNLLHAISGKMERSESIGGIRETFFANQLRVKYNINTHPQTDFLVQDTYAIEVGGPNKDYNQIKSLDKAYLALDGITIGFRNKIPLYLFGFLY